MTRSDFLFHSSEKKVSIRKQRVVMGVGGSWSWKVANLESVTLPWWISGWTKTAMAGERRIMEKECGRFWEENVSDFGFGTWCYVFWIGKGVWVVLEKKVGGLVLGQCCIPSVIMRTWDILQASIAFDMWSNWVSLIYVFLPISRSGWVTRVHFF